MFNLEGDERISMIGRGYYSDREASDHTTGLDGLPASPPQDCGPAWRLDHRVIRLL